MPHVVAKLWPGKSEQQKTRLAAEIAKEVMTILNYGEESVSVRPRGARGALNSRCPAMRRMDRSISESAI
jgi:hypothetical protein